MSQRSRDRLAMLAAGVAARRRNQDLAPCVYCGVAANSIDHVPPQSARPRLLELGLERKYPFFEVEACRECNSALGARGLWTLVARRDYIKKFLRRRYRGFLNIPDWTDTELAQLSPMMLEYTLNGIAIRDFTRDRISYAEPMAKKTKR
jgi:hypothetical protein